MNIPSTLLLIIGLTVAALFAIIFIAALVITMCNRQIILRCHKCQKIN